MLLCGCLRRTGSRLGHGNAKAHCSPAATPVREPVCGRSASSCGRRASRAARSCGRLPPTCASSPAYLDGARGRRPRGACPAEPYALGLPAQLRRSSGARRRSAGRAAESRAAPAMAVPARAPPSTAGRRLPGAALVAAPCIASTLRPRLTARRHRCAGRGVADRRRPPAAAAGPCGRPLVAATAAEPTRFAGAAIDVHAGAVGRAGRWRRHGMPARADARAAATGRCSAVRRIRRRSAVGRGSGSSMPAERPCRACRRRPLELPPAEACGPRARAAPYRRLLRVEGGFELDMVALSERTRHRTHAVRVGDVTVGGGAPVVVQSMTNTDTADVTATTAQVIELARAGSEIVRITVNNDEAARAVPAIRERLDLLGHDVPLVGDFHYNGHRLLADYPEHGASARQVAHQPRQCRLRREARPPVRDDDRGGAALRAAGPHRRQLGQPRPGSGDPADGRERASRASRSRPTSCCARRWCARRSTVPPMPSGSAWVRTGS